MRGRDPGRWVDGIPECHDTYWGTMEAMEEGNPTLMLERGEKVLTPPALWVQGRPDEVHDYLDTDSDVTLNEPERFVENYRKAGGEIDLVIIEQETRSLEEDKRKNAWWANVIASNRRRGEPPSFLEDYWALNAEVTPESLHAAAKEYLDRGRVVKVVLMPETKGE